MALDLEGCRTLVTGGSSGIGAGLAEALAERGAVVGICARRADRLSEVVGRCMEHSPDSRMWVVNLADIDAVDQLAVDVIDAFGGVDLLVNNAGIPKRRHVTALDIDTITAVMHVNYLSPMRLTDGAAAPDAGPGLGHHREHLVDRRQAQCARRGRLRRLEGGAHRLLRGHGRRPVGDGHQGDGRLPGRHRHRAVHPARQRRPRPAGGGRARLGGVDAILAGLESGAAQVYVPEWFHGVAANKEKDVGAFLEGTAAYLREQKQKKEQSRAAHMNTGRSSPTQPG